MGVARIRASLLTVMKRGRRITCRCVTAVGPYETRYWSVTTFRYWARTAMCNGY
jgi:hypothetical protein